MTHKGSGDKAKSILGADFASLDPKSKDIAQGILDILAPMSPKARATAIEAAGVQLTLKDRWPEYKMRADPPTEAEVREQVMKGAANAPPLTKARYAALSDRLGSYLSSKPILMSEDRIRIEAEYNRLASELQSIDEVIEWCDGTNLKLSKPGESVWHKVAAAHASNTILVGPLPSDQELADRFAKETPHIILVEHDWASVFEGATDFDTGHFKLPFPRCCFEFILGGKRVCAVMIERGEEIDCLPFVVTSKHVHVMLGYTYRDGDWVYQDGSVIKTDDESLIVHISRHVRAVSIALEAEVASAVSVGAPTKLNAARAKKGLGPILGHSVVRLIKRSHYGLHDRSGSGTAPKWQVRLHFRRGHWRTYPDYKMWIKWMLVGNPDLGFIEKHYRL